MSTSELEKLQRDTLAWSVARALAAANVAAADHGMPVEQALVTITEHPTAPTREWHVHYGPRDYVHRRGGDLTVVVDAAAGAVRRIIRGQ